MTFQDRFLTIACRCSRAAPLGRRTFFRAFRWLAGDPESFVMKFDDFYFVIDCLDSDVAMRVALNEYYEPIVAALFLDAVEPGAIVFDIGANKGLYSLLAARACRPQGKVIAYEPDPRNLADLQRDAELNPLLNLIVEGRGLGSYAGTARFEISGWDEGVSAWGKVVPKDTVDHPGKHVEVQVTTLDNEVARLGIEQIDVLKMDIQGGEAEALVGMTNTLSEGRIGTFLLELHDNQLGKSECEEILARITSAGYRGRFFSQECFSHEEAIRAIHKESSLEILQRGWPANEYNYNQRHHNLGYIKPLQFLFKRSWVEQTPTP